MKTALVTSDGQVKVSEVPAPVILAGSARVQVARSLISTGTETDFIRQRRSAPVEGDFRPGYSAVGRIVELAPDCRKGAVGQRVACAGWALATHSQQIVVPRNLFVPVPDGVDDDNAACIGCAVTCMHALRQGGVSGGDGVAVFGMGLFGQLTARIAAAFGARVFAVAKHPHQRQLAGQVCQAVWSPQELLDKPPADAAGGLVDVAIIAAGGDQSEMIRSAGRLLRDRGTIVILGRGWASIDFREEMFKKELTLRNTRAYGPGRYDPQYEREGIDYPIGYVRWTETRNMSAVLELMDRGSTEVTRPGRLDLRPLITSRCRLEDVPAAYERLLEKRPPQIATLVEYE